MLTSEETSEVTLVPSSEETSVGTSEVTPEVTAEFSSGSSLKVTSAASVVFGCEETVKEPAVTAEGDSASFPVEKEDVVESSRCSVIVLASVPV